MAETTKTPKKADDQPKKETAKKKPAKPKDVQGVVFNCARLNVRVAPSQNARILCILKKDEVVTVDMEKSKDLFYSIRMKDGRTGYCMKKFLQLR